MDTAKPNIVTSTFNSACKLSYFFTKSNNLDIYLLADGVKTLNLDLKTLAIDNGLSTLMCGQTPIVTVTSITTRYNFRPTHLVVSGDRIIW